MKNIIITIVAALSFEISAQEFPSDETLGEVVRNTSIEMLFKNEAIIHLNNGKIKKAKNGLCVTLETNLLLLKWLSKHAPKVEAETLRRSVSHIANSKSGCDFSDDISTYIERYK